MVTRREVIKGLGILAAGSLFPKVSFASVGGSKRLVVIILRGGMDGLAACVPFADRNYHELRGSMALAQPGKPNGALPLDSFFGLHPSMTEMHELYQARELLAFHAVALPAHTRSHFDAQDVLENGSDTAHGKNDGWLNRALKLFAPADSPLGMSIGQTTPLLLRGDAPISTWSPARLPKLDDDLIERLDRIYAADPQFHQLLHAGLATDAMASNALEGGMGGGGRGDRFNPIAQVIGKFLREERGPRIAAVDIGGWDTHANQGLLEGRLANNLGQLSAGLGTLKNALGPVWSDTAVLVLTEFGRTVKPNGTGGTDHGTAGAAFLAGGAVSGGRVVADWPGLGANKLFEGRDLAPTIDVRSIIQAVLVEHFELAAADIGRLVLPGAPSSKLVGGLIR